MIKEMDTSILSLLNLEQIKEMDTSISALLSPDPKDWGVLFYNNNTIWIKQAIKVGNVELVRYILNTHFKYKKYKQSWLELSCIHPVIFNILLPKTKITRPFVNPYRMYDESDDEEYEYDDEFFNNLKSVEKLNELKKTYRLKQPFIDWG